MRNFAHQKPAQTNTTDVITSPAKQKQSLPSPVQRAQIRTQSDLSISQPGDREEQEADQTTDMIVSNNLSLSPQLSVNPLIGKSSQHPVEKHPANHLPAIDPIARTADSGTALSVSTKQYFEPRFGHDLSRVRLHSGIAAAQMSKRIGARAFTQGQDIYFGENQFNTNSYDGRRLLAHELTHTLQSESTQDHKLQRDKVAGLSDTIRDGLRISRSAPKPADIATSVSKFFDPKKGTSENSGIPIEVDPAITDAQHIKGFKSLASELANNSRSSVNAKDENKPLGSNSIVDIDVDPSAHGGIHAIYRFIRYTDGKGEKIYVEKLGSAAPVQSNAPVRAPTPQPVAAGATKEADKAPIDRTFLHGSVPVDTISIEIASSFANDDARAIVAAVQLLPAATRAKIDGLEFIRSSKATSDDGAAGEYDPNTDKITLFRSIFSDTSRKVGVQSSTTYGIVHEIAHAIDLRPEMEAERETKKAEEEKKKLERIANRISIGDPNDPLAGLGDLDTPDPAKEKAKQDIAKLDKKIADLSKKLGKGKSLSGNEIGADTESLKTDFGKALKKDGVKVVTGAKKTNKATEVLNKANPTQPATPAIDTLTGNITLYGNKNLMEAFAENFTFYTLDPDLLKSTKPHTYAYFLKNFPKAATPKAKP